MEDQW